MKKFTESQIRNYTSDVVLRRGIALEAAGGVRLLETFPAEGGSGKKYMDIFALVDGSSGNTYTVESRLTADGGELYDVYCECPAFAKYNGLCKHCVAMFIHYFRDENYYIRMAMDKDDAFNFDTRQKTDTHVTTLLEKYDKKERQMSSGSIAPGQIRLEPTLHLSYKDTSVSFKIGMKQLYVVKDVHSLVRRVKQVEKYSYGKNLSFLHQIEAFDEKSRPLMEYLIRLLEDKINYYSSGERYISLYDAELDEFLDMTAKDGLLVDYKTDYPKKWTMTDEPFLQSVTIELAQDGAFIKCSPAKKIYTKNYNYYFNGKGNTIHRQSRISRNEADEIEDFLYRYDKTESFISEDDLPLFVRGILPVLEKYYNVKKKNIDLSIYLPEEACFNIYLDLPQDNMVTCDLVADYGEGGEYHVFEGVPKKSSRNVPQELKAQKAVMDYCNAFDDAKHLAVMADDEDGIYRLLTDGIADFRKWADVYISDALKRISEVRRPQVSVGVSLSGDLLDLKVTSDDIPLDELAAILSKYDRKKKYIRLKDGSFISAEDENLDTLAQIKKGLMLSDKDFVKGDIELPKYRAFFLDSQFKENTEISLSRNRDFRALIRDMHNIEERDYEIPSSLETVLREYQKTGCRWIETLYVNGFGGILADDMGLGKTLQVIAFLLSHYEKQPEGELRTLIVCPASLVYNWEDEFKRYAPGLPVFIAAGSASERRELLAALPGHAILVTSYDLLKRDAEEYEKLRFEFQILDEAQFIKNAVTKAAHGVKMIHSSFRLALTGTPVENRLSELWSIFDYLMPGYLFSYQKFRAEIETPIVQNGDKDALKRVQKMISPFILRRLKKDVLKDLPDKIERNMAARMEGEQKELYDAHVKRLALFLDRQAPEEFDKSKIQILAELTKLRQLCCDPALMYENYNGGSAKLDLCMDLAENAVDGGHKILIFSQFTSMLSRIAKRLSDKGIEYYMLTGATAKQERIRMVNAFNKDDVPVFCISLKAGGTGLNLTAADIVIHYDPWWNTAAQNQATDRTHRIGQKNVVTVYSLIAKDSIEENIVKLQKKKKELADSVISQSQTAGLSFSKEDLMELLSVRNG